MCRRPFPDLTRCFNEPARAHCLAGLCCECGANARPRAGAGKVGASAFCVSARRPHRSSTDFCEDCANWASLKDSTLSSNRRLWRRVPCGYRTLRLNWSVAGWISSWPPERRPVLPARDAAGQIPVVFVATLDPVSTGLVASLARPGRNITGMTSISGDLIAKRLQMTREVLPKLTQIARILVRDVQSDRSPVRPGMPVRGAETGY